MQWMVHLDHHHLLVRPPSSSSRMNRPVPPASPLPPGTPYQNPDPAYASFFARQRASKFMPRQDDPYVILSQRSPTTFEEAKLFLLGPITPQHYVLIKILRLSLFVKEADQERLFLADCNRLYL
ncbi:hypothetical protein TNIN_150401 [Trichonephila inaurata madagascariensis]|uniref:Uncharacterized protein n=1 Tax=Trichonephila inaurata madagascariensis TaxID=2747483 RepID=A0A8X6XDS2_9ARAC|nr:hypothetical protein TNIN_150401 [Trichonephila inaurata madagascariensis]